MTWTVLVSMWTYHGNVLDIAIALVQAHQVTITNVLEYQVNTVLDIDRHTTRVLTSQVVPVLFGHVEGTVNRVANRVNQSPCGQLLNRIISALVQQTVQRLQVGRVALEAVQIVNNIRCLYLELDEVKEETKKDCIVLKVDQGILYSLFAIIDKEYWSLERT